MILEPGIPGHNLQRKSDLSGGTVTAGVGATLSVLILAIEEESHRPRTAIFLTIGINRLLYGAIGLLAKAGLTI